MSYLIIENKNNGSKVTKRVNYSARSMAEAAENLATYICEMYDVEDYHYDQNAVEKSTYEDVCEVLASGKVYEVDLVRFNIIDVKREYPNLEKMNKLFMQYYNYEIHDDYDTVDLIYCYEYGSLADLLIGDEVIHTPDSEDFYEFTDEYKAFCSNFLKVLNY